MSRRILLLLAALTYFISFNAYALSDPFSERILFPLKATIETAPANGASVAEWGDCAKREWLALDHMASLIYDEYNRGNWTPTMSDSFQLWCLNHYRDYCRRLAYAERRVFLEKSLAQLREAKSPSIKLL